MSDIAPEELSEATSGSGLVRSTGPATVLATSTAPLVRPKGSDRSRETDVGAAMARMAAG
jgi:hypothetical protein